LDLAEEELDQLAPQLDEIITTLARVQEVPTEGIPRTSDALQLTSAFRSNVVAEPLLDPRDIPTWASAAQQRFGVPPTVAKD
jgi:aspartyl-tRNA(Asn)/glutamyl-tRNA(Gln) amidotransferase subunit C